MNRWILAGIAMATLTACSSAPKAGGQVADAMKSKIEAAIREQITDPESLKVQWLPLSANLKMYCLRINAKNGMGGYVGYKPAIVFFADETQSEIREISLASSSSDVAFSAEQCLRQGYNTLNSPT